MIAQHVLVAYTTRFPHLRFLAELANSDLRIARAFAQNACRLAAPPGVSASEIWALARIASA